VLILHQNAFVIGEKRKVNFQVGVNKIEADYDALENKKSDLIVWPFSHIPNHDKAVSNSHEDPNPYVVLSFFQFFFELSFFVK
jgi:hypothetical protein